MRNFKLLLGVVCASMVVSSISSAAEDKRLDTIVITATRSAKPQNEVVGSVAVIQTQEIEFISPAHPQELLNRTPGVHINNLGGEGHMTAIRQPITTGGMYLFLEDGIPTRPTGLFNHNALYEINIPQADRIEVVKGPGSALYGSDSIGGIINSITKPSPDTPAFKINPEYGSYGWKRLLVSGGTPVNDDLGIRVDLNLTDNEGYREQSGYRRYATTGRIDGFIGDRVAFKTILSYTYVDQSGVSSLEADDYHNNNKKNLYHNDVGRRTVDALRLSTEFTYKPDTNSRYTITPFFRNNQMQLMPSWMLTYDANDRDYRFQSYGLLAQYARSMPKIRGEFIIGMDLDYTPSSYKEVRLRTIRSTDIFTDAIRTGRINYDFDADQIAISPYIHGEWQILARLRLTGGLRYDYFKIDYTDKLTPSVMEMQSGPGGFRHLRPDSQDRSYDSLSPKLGLIYQLANAHDLYAYYRHSFRVPSINQLFRSGSSIDTADLEPVKTDSIEVGIRGQWYDWLDYDIALYRMIVKDDIINYIDNISGDRRVTNAGETEHKGIEFGLYGDIDVWGFRATYSLSDQEYNDYTAVFGFPATQINYAGNAVGKAPKTLANLAIQYRPRYLADTQFEIEWEHVGRYYTDERNSQKYNGHNLFNIRAHYNLDETIQLYGRILNLADRLYSVYTSNQVGDPDIEYRPGLPRTFYVGIRALF